MNFMQLVKKSRSVTLVSVILLAMQFAHSLNAESQRRLIGSRFGLRADLCELAHERQIRPLKGDQKLYMSDEGRMRAFHKFLKFAEKVFGKEAIRNNPNHIYHYYKQLNYKSLTLADHIDFIAGILQVDSESLRVQFGFYKDPSDLSHPRWMKLKIFLSEVDRMMAEDLDTFRSRFSTKNKVLKSRAKDLNDLTKELLRRRMITPTYFDRIRSLTELNEKMRLIRKVVWKDERIQIATLAMREARTLLPGIAAKVRFKPLGDEHKTEWWHILNWHTKPELEQEGLHYSPSRTMHDGFVMAVQKRLNEIPVP